MVKNVMPTIGMIAAGGMMGLVRRRWVIELRGIKSADRQQDFQRHIWESRPISKCFWGRLPSTRPRH